MSNRENTPNREGTVHLCKGGCGRVMQHPIVCSQCSNRIKAGVNADIAEALHKIHYSWARTAMSSNWLECYSCCTYANCAGEVIATRSLGAVAQ